MNLIDADALLAKVKEMGIFPVLLVDTIEKIPKIEIVNCESCRYWYNSTGKRKEGICKHPLNLTSCDSELHTIYSHFCGYGKRGE